MNEISTNTQPMISEDLTIDGNLESSGSVVVNGTVNGDVSVAKLSLEVSGKIKGNVKADSAELMGVQRGKVQVRLLTIRSGAVLKGAVNCEELIVESGAAISGKFRVKPKEAMSTASRFARKH